MHPESYLPFIIYMGAVLVLAIVMLTASYFLGERHTAKAKEEIYESGINPTGSARIHFPVHFYLIAMFFVIFDLEAIFLFIWSASLRETGWSGYSFGLVFVAELAILLFYLWKSGALDFGPDGKKILKIFHEKIKIQGDEMVDE